MFSDSESRDVAEHLRDVGHVPLHARRRAAQDERHPVLRVQHVDHEPDPVESSLVKFGIRFESNLGKFQQNILVNLDEIWSKSQFKPDKLDK